MYYTTQDLETHGTAVHIYHCVFLQDWQLVQSDMLQPLVPHLFVGGNFQDSIDIDPGTQTTTLVAVAYYSNTFISKFDTSGTLLWAEVLNGTGHNYPKWCQEDTNNEIVIV